jgi:ectoine hydroxylase-related dioxygenase (phytanoyl-CoA dioxygenase family)
MTIVRALKDYHSQGVGIINGLLTDHEVAELKNAIEKIQASVSGLAEDLKNELIFEKDLPGKNRADIPASTVGDSIFIIGDPIKFDSAFEKLLTKKAFYDIASQILETEQLMFHFINVTIKQAHFGRAIAMHRDYPNDYICTSSSRFFRLMICLDGMTEINGATQYLPGSHLLSDDLATMKKRKGIYTLEKLKTIECSQGSCVLIHPKLLHGGGMNTSLSPRRNIVIQVGDAAEALLTTNKESITGKRLNPLLF